MLFMGQSDNDFYRDHTGSSTIIMVPLYLVFPEPAWRCEALPPRYFRRSASAFATSPLRKLNRCLFKSFVSSQLDDYHNHIPTWVALQHPNLGFAQYRLDG